MHRCDARVHTQLHRHESARKLHVISSHQFSADSVVVLLTALQYIRQPQPWQLHPGCWRQCARRWRHCGNPVIQCQPHLIKETPSMCFTLASVKWSHSLSAHEPPTAPLPTTTWRTVRPGTSRTSKQLAVGAPPLAHACTRKIRSITRPKSRRYHQLARWRASMGRRQIAASTRTRRTASRTPHLRWGGAAELQVRLCDTVQVCICILLCDSV